VELTRNELPNTASAMSRTSSVDSLENAIRAGREEDEKARVEEEKKSGEREVRFTNENMRVVKNILGSGGNVKVAPAPEGELDAASPKQKSVTIRDEMDLGDGDNNIVFPAEASSGPSKPALTKQWSTKTMWNTAVKSVVNTMKLRHTLSRSFQHVPSTMRELQDSASTRFVHRTPLLVYIYEGILLDIFDSYDFYPGAEMSGVCKGVLNMNLSTEGVDDLSDLQEMGLLLRLKLATKDHFTTTSYQVMPAGVAALKSMKQLDKNDVDRFLIHGVRVETPQMLRATHYDPHEYAWLNNGEEFDALGAPRPEFTPFEISFDDLTGEFNLVDPDGNERVSTVTEFEDVSYVCSPYLPSCVRPKETRHSTQRDFSDFSSLAHMSAEGTHTMRDADVRNHVFMNNITLLSSQYLVNGPNEVNSLNQKLSLHASRE
jgi:hypothetical protein